MNILILSFQYILGRPGITKQRSPTNDITSPMNISTKVNAFVSAK